ncbi:MAG: carbonic anhydrase [Hellea sp.]|nr:carbonic anhydrase [Hellea sp.]
MSEWRARLEKGYQDFKSGDFLEQKALYETLGTHGQNPDIMLIACADSRVDPTDIFNAYPGEMFVARNVANIVPPAGNDEAYHGTLAAIEYAVTVLEVDVIVILGHESCGGIAGCLAGLGETGADGYVGSWVSILNDAKNKLIANNPNAENLQFEMELEGIRQSIRNLMTYRFVKDVVETGKLKLQGAYFGIHSAELMLADDDGQFIKV